MEIQYLLFLFEGTPIWMLYISLRMIKFHTQSSTFVYKQNNAYELVVSDIYIRILDRYIEIAKCKISQEKILKSKASKAVKIICYFL